MKSKLLIVCLLMGVIVQTSRAGEPGTYSAVIGGFIDGHISGNAKKLDAILADDAMYKIPRQDKVIIQPKDALLGAMRKEKGVIQNCTSSYQLLAKTDALILARVDFKYPGFVQHNYLTIEKTEGDWKISQVCKISESTEAARSGSFPVVTTVE